MEMPDIEHGAYLLEYLSEIGEARHNGQTLSPIDWQEIRAWQSATGMQLSAWDAKTLRHLSAAYVAQYWEAGEPNCPPPWMPEQPNAERITKRLDSMMGVIGAKP
jgi:hypothetical protein